MKQASRLFREKLARDPYVFAPGVYDAVGAQIAQRVGHQAVYLSGYSTASAQWGVTDIGIIQRFEMVYTAHRVVDALKLAAKAHNMNAAPVIADADDGYGDAIHMQRTMEEYMKTGVAGVHIEDQKGPKRCGHMAGRRVLPLAESLGKLRAALDVRDENDRNFIVIARTDSLGAVGGSMEKAKERGIAYADAGADLIWCEFGTPDRQKAEEFAGAVRGTHPDLPLAFNYSSSFQWHKQENPMTFKELAQMGYRYIFITLFAYHAATHAMWDGMQALVRVAEHGQWELERQKDGHPTQSHHKLSNAPYYQELEKTYSPEAAERIKQSEGFREGDAH